MPPWIRLANCSALFSRFFGRYWEAANCSDNFCIKNFAVWKAPCCMAVCIAIRSLWSSTSIWTPASMINSQSPVLPFSAATCNGVRMSLVRLWITLRFTSLSILYSWKIGRWPARAAMCKNVVPSSDWKFLRRLSKTSMYLCALLSASISSICAHQGSVSSSWTLGRSLSLPFTTACAAKKFWKPFTKNLNSVLPPSWESRKNIACPAWTAAFKPSHTCWVSGSLGRMSSTSLAVMPTRRWSCIIMLIFSRMILATRTFLSLLCLSACCLLCTRWSITSSATRYTAVNVAPLDSSATSSPSAACLAASASLFFMVWR
mmetsp:Transcript_28286/g.85255  ORF Transcript_28286/g.85255 Transcript_28286/m.85255 type:complete len:317 (-) Transcript_28286:850-1800(-)